jgi:hypothetical protein
MLPVRTALESEMCCDCSDCDLNSGVTDLSLKMYYCACCRECWGMVKHQRGTIFWCGMACKIFSLHPHLGRQVTKLLNGHRIDGLFSSFAVWGTLVVGGGCERGSR